MNITAIGLGEAGCNLAERFESHCNVKLIDVDIEGDNCFSLQKQNNPEDYEKNFPDISSFLSDCYDTVLFFVGGGGKVSGASLRLLSHIKDKKIYIFYIRPDTNLLGTVAKMQDRLVFKVLQEYVRSGVFAGMVLISNETLENLMGDNLPVSNYFSKINDAIYAAIMTLMFRTETPVIDNYSEPKKTSCLCTYGVYDMDKDVDELFYNIKDVSDKCYHFFITKHKLENDGQLFKKIKNIVKNKAVDNIKVSYIITPTTAENNYCYVTAFSSKIQE